MAFYTVLGGQGYPSPSPNHNIWKNTERRAVSLLQLRCLFFFLHGVRACVVRYIALHLLPQRRSWVRCIWRWVKKLAVVSGPQGRVTLSSRPLLYHSYVARCDFSLSSTLWFCFLRLHVRRFYFSPTCSLSRRLMSTSRAVPLTSREAARCFLSVTVKVWTSTVQYVELSLLLLVTSASDLRRRTIKLCCILFGVVICAAGAVIHKIHWCVAVQ